MSTNSNNNLSSGSSSSNSGSVWWTVGLVEATALNEIVSTNNAAWPTSFLCAISADARHLIIAIRDQIILWQRQPTAEVPSFEATQPFRVNVESPANISALCCVTVATKQDGERMCILAGFRDGYLRAFTEDGKILLAQRLHKAPVTKVIFRTSRWRGVDSADSEELCIHYPDAVVAIDGLSFYSTLLACFRQLNSQTETNLSPPPIAYKKWSFGGYEQLSDAVSCGSWNVPSFGILQQPAPTVRFLGGGNEPFLALHETSDEARPLLSTVAIATSLIAARLTSAVVSFARGWLGSTSSSQTAQKNSVPEERIAAATSLPQSGSLHDKNRSVLSVTLDPTCTVAAVVDSLGRILLVDTASLTAVRMWKGYRDAQCIWVEATQEASRQSKQSSLRRSTFFLAIYAPRRGLLELWHARHGSRVAAFNIGPNCVLVSTNATALGASFRGIGSTSITSISAQATMLTQAFVIMPSGHVRQLIPSFDSSIQSVASASFRDRLRLRQFNEILAQPTAITSASAVTLANVLRSIETPTTKLQALLSLPTLEDTIATTLITAAVDSGDKLVDTESESSGDILLLLNRLLNLHGELMRLASPKPAPQIDANEPSTPTEQNEETSASDSALQSTRTAIKLLQQWTLFLDENALTEDASETTTLRLVQFLKLFEWRHLEAHRTTDVGLLPLVALEPQTKASLASFLFQGLLARQDDNRFAHSVLPTLVSLLGARSLTELFVSWFSSIRLLSALSLLPSWNSTSMTPSPLVRMGILTTTTSNKEVATTTPPKVVHLEGSPFSPSVDDEDNAAIKNEPIENGPPEVPLDDVSQTLTVDLSWALEQSQLILFTERTEKIGHALVISAVVSASLLADPGALISDQDKIWITRMQALSDCFRLYAAMSPDLLKRFPLSLTQWFNAKADIVLTIVERLQTDLLVVPSSVGNQTLPRQLAVQKKHVAALRSHFAELLPYDLSAAYRCWVCWELYIANQTKLEYLEQSIEQILAIGHPLLRHALVLHLWTPPSQSAQHKTMQSMTGLICMSMSPLLYTIEKMKRAPKERQLISALGIGIPDTLRLLNAAEATLGVIQFDAGSTPAAPNQPTTPSSSVIDVTKIAGHLAGLLANRPILIDDKKQSFISGFPSSVVSSAPVISKTARRSPNTPSALFTTEASASRLPEPFGTMSSTLALRTVLQTAQDLVAQPLPSGGSAKMPLVISRQIVRQHELAIRILRIALQQPHLRPVRPLTLLDQDLPPVLTGITRREQPKPATPVSTVSPVYTAAVEERLQFVVHLVTLDEKQALSLMETWQLDPDPIWQELALFLYKQEQDARADEIAARLKNITKLGREVVVLARQQFANFQLQQPARARELIAAMPGDVRDWLQKNPVVKKDVAATAAAAETEKPPPTPTHPVTLARVIALFSRADKLLPANDPQVGIIRRLVQLLRM